MRNTIAKVLIGWTVASPCVVVAEANDEPLEGTFSVGFKPLQSGGVKQSCELTYAAIVRDYTYRNGTLVYLDGSITFWTNRKQTGALLVLKLGTRMLEGASKKPTAPFFVYLQTPHGNLSQTPHSDISSTEGYRTFAFTLDANAVNILKDLITGEPLKLGFNMLDGGLDLLVPLDVTVESTDEQDGKILRSHSTTAIDQLAECITDVAGRQLNKHGEG